jgi:hypothetical protein
MMMETKEYRTIDRKEKNWPSGPWDGEPDKIQFTDEATGLPCLIVRVPYSGHLCGYVGVPSTHKYYGKNYEETNVSVHWGLTFADKCQPSVDESKGICHTPSGSESDDVWWFGFDCAHCDDLTPQYMFYAQTYGLPFTRSATGTYKTVEFVMTECKSLAAQLLDTPK